MLAIGEGGNLLLRSDRVLRVALRGGRARGGDISLCLVVHISQSVRRLDRKEAAELGELSQCKARPRQEVFGSILKYAEMEVLWHKPGW